MKKLRWKREPRATGLMAVGAAPRGSKLWDGENVYAATIPMGGGWRGPLEGWYWHTEGDHVSHKNTFHNPCDTEEEAKKQAKVYVMNHLKT